MRAEPIDCRLAAYSLAWPGIAWHGRLGTSDVRLGPPRGPSRRVATGRVGSVRSGRTGRDGATSKQSQSCKMAGWLGAAWRRHTVLADWPLVVAQGAATAAATRGPYPGTHSRRGATTSTSTLSTSLRATKSDVLPNSPARHSWHISLKVSYESKKRSDFDPHGAVVFS